MKRKVQLVPYESAPKESQQVYSEAMQTLSLTRTPNWLAAFGSNPRLARANWEKFRLTVLEGEVSPLLKQLLLFVISYEANNEYCTAAHGHAALSMDSTLGCTDLYELTRGGTHKNLPSACKVALKTIPALVRPDGELTPQQTSERLKEAGFDEAEILELFAQADIGAMFNIIMASLDIPPDRPFPSDEAER